MLEATREIIERFERLCHEIQRHIHELRHGRHGLTGSSVTGSSVTGAACGHAIDPYFHKFEPKVIGTIEPKR